MIAKIEAEANEREDRTPVEMPPLDMIPDATPDETSPVQHVDDDMTVPIQTTPGNGSSTIASSYASALRPSTGTAKLLPQHPGHRGVWLAVAICAIIVGVVIALAIR